MRLWAWRRWRISTGPQDHSLPSPEVCLRAHGHCGQLDYRESTLLKPEAPAQILLARLSPPRRLLVWGDIGCYQLSRRMNIERVL